MRARNYSHITNFALIDEEVQIALNAGATTRDAVEAIWRARYPHATFAARQICLSAIWKKVKEALA